MRAPHEDDSWCVSQHIPGSHNIAAGRDVHIGRAAPPPPNHPQAICCPQCRCITWRATRLCVNCDFEIGAWQERRDDEVRRLRERARLRRVAGRLALCSVTCALVAYSNFFVGLEQAFVCGLAFVFGLGAFKGWEMSAK